MQKKQKLKGIYNLAMLPKDVVQLILIQVPRHHIYRRVCRDWNRWLSEEEFIKKWERLPVFSFVADSHFNFKNTICFLSDLREPQPKTAPYNGFHYIKPEHGIVELNAYRRGKIISCLRRFYTWVYKNRKIQSRVILIEEDNKLMMYSQSQDDECYFQYFYKVCKFEKIQARINVCSWRKTIKWEQIDRDPYNQAQLPEEKIDDVPGKYIFDKFGF